MSRFPVSLQECSGAPPLPFLQQCWTGQWDTLENHWPLGQGVYYLTYYQYNQRQDLLIRNQSFALLGFLLSVTYVSACPVLHVLAAVLCLLSPHFPDQHVDLGTRAYPGSPVPTVSLR